VRIINGKLRIEPHLPASWHNLQYQINWQGSLLRVTVIKDKMAISVVGDGVSFINHGVEYQIPADSKIELEIPATELVNQ